MTRLSMERTHLVLCQLLDAGLFEGAQVYVSVAEQPVVDEALGMARPGVPLTRTSRVPWLCASKTVGGLVACELIRQGLMSERTRIASLLTGLSPSADYTVGDLVRHRILWVDEPSLDAMFWPSHEEALRRALKALNEGQPSTDQHHCSYSLWRNWAILAAIIETVTGASYPDVCRELVLTPAGALTSSFILTPSDYHVAAGQIAGLFQCESSPPTLVPFIGTERSCTTCCPGTGGFGPIRELARVFESTVRDGRDNGLIGLLLASDGSRVPIMSFDNLQLDWGLGVLRTGPLLGSRLFGARAFGQGAQDTTISLADIDRQLVICVWFNGLRSRAISIHRARSVVAAIMTDISDV